MHATLSALLDHGPVLLDGGCGTELQKRGLEVGGTAEQWNLERPQDVECVARAYVEAGSRVLVTNTFRANRLALRNLDLCARMPEINVAAVRIARRAAGVDCCVFGSMGPSGSLVTGASVAWAEIERAFREQAVVLADAGVDGLVIETMVEPDELRCAVAAAAATGLPLVACLVLPRPASAGVADDWESAVVALEAAGVDVIGTNCGCDIVESIAVCRLLKSRTRLPLWIKPNAGLPQQVEGRPVYRPHLDLAPRYVADICGAGASFFGGCCGTGPEFIRACAAAHWHPRSA